MKKELAYVFSVEKLVDVAVNKTEESQIASFRILEQHDFLLLFSECCGSTYPATSFTMSLTKAVRLLR